MKDCTVSGKENKSRLKNECLTIDLPCNPSQRVETVTSHSHSLFPDQEVRDLNNPLVKGGGSEQTSTLTPISARDFSTLVKQMGFSFYVDGNGKLLISLSQPSVHSEEVESRTQAERSEQHGVPAGEFKTESTSANGKDNTPKHAPGNGDCICKHGSGAITKTFVEQNGLCSCECHKEVRF